MRLTQFGIGKIKLDRIDNMYPAQDILFKSGQIIQFGTGIYAYNNVPLRVKQKIENIIRTELTKSGCVEIELPTLQPREIWDASGRWNKYVMSGTMFTSNTKKGEYCLAPTAEEAVVEFAKNKIKSYKDLPVILFQIGEKYRNEIRTRGFLLRGKSFPMMDAYSFNINEQDLVNSYNKIKDVYLKIFKYLELPVIPVIADNGAIGGKKSEEFMVLSNIGEDTILYDEEKGIALNIELLEKENYRNYLKKEYNITDTNNLKPKKAVELGHIFQLGKEYSRSMNANYINYEGKSQALYMGCYGIGISRTLATIYEMSVIKDKNGNAKGISLPKKLAPYCLQIIPKSDNSEKMKEAEELYKFLQEKGIEVILDDRKNTTIGSSIMDCKILGTPYMIILGDKVNVNEIEIENTKNGQKNKILKHNILNFINENMI